MHLKMSCVQLGKYGKIDTSGFCVKLIYGDDTLGKYKTSVQATLTMPWWGGQ